MPLDDVKRYAGHLFWTLSSQALELAPIRFVLFPLVAYFVGAEGFGALVTAQGVVLMLGVAPAQGLAAGLFRDVAQYPREKHPQFYVTSLRLCHRAMLVIVLIGVGATVVVGALDAAPRLVLLCVLAMTVSLYAENQYFLTLSELQVNRRFTRRAAQEGIRAALTLSGGILGMLAGGAVGTACGLAVGQSISYAIVRHQRRSWFTQPSDAEMGAKLKAVWFYMALASILALSGQYLVRILLSVWHSLAEVAVFYGASAVLNLFLIPVSCSGVLLLSMLARHRSMSQLSGRAKGYVMLLVFVAACAMPLMLHLCGPIALRILFPKLAEQSLPLLHIVVWAAPFACLSLLLRPLVIKFGATWHVPTVNGVALASYSLPCLLLIPWYGLRGAAWALLTGHAVTGLFWLVLSLRVFLKPSASVDR